MSEIGSLEERFAGYDETRAFDLFLVYGLMFVLNRDIIGVEILFPSVLDFFYLFHENLTGKGKSSFLKRLSLT